MGAGGGTKRLRIVGAGGSTKRLRIIGGWWWYEEIENYRGLVAVRRDRELWGAGFSSVFEHWLGTLVCDCRHFVFSSFSSQHQM